MRKILIFMTEDWITDNLMKGQLEFLSRYFQLHIVCAQSNRKLYNIPKSANLHYIQLVRKPAVFSDIRSVYQYIKILSKINPDVVLFSTPKCIAIHGIASIFRPSVKGIMIVRGRVYENYIGLKRHFFELLDLLAMRRSKTVLFISKSLKKEYENNKLFFYLSNKFEVVGRGSSNGFDVSNSSRPVQKVSPIRTKLKICYVGRLLTDKGVSDINEICERLHDLDMIETLTVCGPNESNLAVTELFPNLREILTYREWVYDVTAEMQKNDLLLFPSKREGFGNVCIEAALAGIPVFAYRITGVEDAVLDGVSGFLVDPFDKDALFNSVKAFYLNEISTDSERAYDWAISNFSNERVWDFYKEKIYEVING